MSLNPKPKTSLQTLAYRAAHSASVEDRKKFNEERKNLSTSYRNHVKGNAPLPEDADTQRSDIRKGREYLKTVQEVLESTGHEVRADAQKTIASRYKAYRANPTANHKFKNWTHKPDDAHPCLNKDLTKAQLKKCMLNIDEWADGGISDGRTTYLSRFLDKINNGRMSQFNNESGWPIISKEAQRKILGIIADELDILQLRAYMRYVIYPSGQF